MNYYYYELLISQFMINIVKTEKTTQWFPIQYPGHVLTLVAFLPLKFNKYLIVK